MIRFLRFSALNLTLGYIVLGIAVLASFATPLWIDWRHDIQAARIASIQEDFERMVDIFRREGVNALARSIDEQVGTRLASNRLVLFANPAFSRIAGNLTVWPPEITQSSGMFTLTMELGGSTVQTVFMPRTLPGGYNLLVGRDVTRFQHLESLFKLGFAGATGIIILLGILGGLQIRRVLLSEVHGISQTASAIVEGDLSRRLPTNGGRDELDMLAQTVNRMLDQIEQLVHGVRNVSNAIAHDLRTPLAELRSRLEELSVTRPSPGETFAEIESAVADVDRVIGIFHALLRLAEIDTGTRRSGFVQVDVARIASEAAEFYQPVAELKGVMLTFVSSGELTVAGDPLLLAQAIGNLIDNALKYAQEGGAITVQAIRRSDGAIEVSVSDDGPGIPDDEKLKVTERFYRGDASRGTEGVGLGLSLVAAVAKLHGGVLELTDNHPGLRATLIMFAANIHPSTLTGRLIQPT
ncbi:MAG: HAMP domain-containing protein [Betaproteobacteria bacterium]|nr:HAMP domain-containing protein [Betaproteobacteria bacterium]